MCSAMIQAAHNKFQELGKSLPVIKYNQTSVTSTKGGVSHWQGECDYEQKLYHGEGRSKPEVKKVIYIMISQYLEAERTGGVLRAYAQPLPLSSPPKGKYRKTRRVNTRGEKGKANKERKTRSFLARVQKYKNFMTNKCSNISCGILNFVKYDRCWECNTLIATKPPVKQQLLAFLDLERVLGNLESPPFNIGVAVFNMQGEVVAKKEIFILPDGDQPSRSSYSARKLHGMFVSSGLGKKVLIGRTGAILPTISPNSAAN